MSYSLKYDDNTEMYPAESVPTGNLPRNTNHHELVTH